MEHFEKVFRNRATFPGREDGDLSLIEVNRIEGAGGGGEEEDCRL